MPSKWCADPRAGSSVEPGAAKDFLGAAPKLPGEKTPVRLADAVPDTSPAAKRMAEGTQVCVRNLAKEAKDEDLKKLFEGALESVAVPRSALGVGEVKEVSIKTLKTLGAAGDEVSLCSGMVCARAMASLLLPNPRRPAT